VNKQSVKLKKRREEPLRKQQKALKKVLKNDI
jgi:hypothetical protein